MSDVGTRRWRDAGVVTVAIALDDPRLAERVIAALDGSDAVRVVSAHDDADVVLVSPDDMPHTVRAEAVPGEGVANAAASGSALTPREREVLALLAEGASNKTIARRLGISVHTAKFHVGSLLDKLDATGRTDAVVHAARLGVIEV